MGRTRTASTRKVFGAAAFVVVLMLGFLPACTPHCDHLRLRVIKRTNPGLEKGWWADEVRTYSFCDDCKEYQGFQQYFRPFLGPPGWSPNETERLYRIGINGKFKEFKEVLPDEDDLSKAGDK